MSCYNLSLCLEARAKAARGMTDESATHAAKAEALAFARRALAIWKKALGDVHPLTGRAQAQVADLEKP